MSIEQREFVLAALCDIVRDNPGIRDDLPALQTRLRAAAPDCDEVEAILLAARLGIPSRLDKLRQQTPLEFVWPEWVETFKQADVEIDEDLARWAIESWAAALSKNLRHGLRDIVQHHPEACHDPQTCRDRLREACPGFPQLAELLTRAVETEIVIDLEKFPQGALHEWIVPSLVSRLHDEKTDPDLARWAVDTWAFALGRKLVPIVRTPETPKTWKRRALDGLLSAAAWAFFGFSLLFFMQLDDPVYSAALFGGIAVAVGAFGGLMGAAFSGTDCVKAGALAAGVVIGCAGAGLGAALAGLTLLLGHLGPAAAGAVFGSILAGAVGALAPNPLIGIILPASGFLSGAVIWMSCCFGLDATIISDVPTVDFLFLFIHLFVDGFGGWWLGKTVAETVGRRYGHKLLKGHVGRVSGVALSPRGQFAASCGGEPGSNQWKEGYNNFVYGTGRHPPREDHSVRIWNPDSGEELLLLTGHQWAVNAIAYSPDGQRITSASGDLTVRIWNTDSGHELHQLEGHWRGVNCVAYSPDGRSLVSGSDDRTVRVWDAETGAEKECFQGHQGAVTAVAFHPSDPGCVISASLDHTVRAWQMGQGDFSDEVPIGQPVRCLAISRDGKHLLAGTDETLVLVDVESREIEQSEATAGPVNAVAFSPEGSRVLVAVESDLFAWDLPSGNKRKISGRLSQIHSVACFEDSGAGLLLTGHHDGTVHLRPAEEGDPVKFLAQDAGETADREETNDSPRQPWRRPLTLFTATGTTATLAALGYALGWIGEDFHLGTDAFGLALLAAIPVLAVAWSLSANPSAWSPTWWGVVTLLVLVGVATTAVAAVVTASLVLGFGAEWVVGCLNANPVRGSFIAGLMAGIPTILFALLWIVGFSSQEVFTSASQLGWTWRTAGAVLMAAGITGLWVLWGGAVGMIVPTANVVFRPELFNQVVLSNSLWQHMIDSSMETGARLAGLVAIIPASLIAMAWMKSEWTRAVVKPRAARGGTKGAIGCTPAVIALPVFTIVLLMRDQSLLPSLFASGVFCALVVAGSIFLGWMCGALLGLTHAVRLWPSQRTEFYALLSEDTLGERHKALRTRVGITLLLFAFFSVFYVLMQINLALPDGTGTATCEGASGPGPNPKFVLVEDIVKDYGNDKAWSDWNYKGRQFQVKGRIADLSERSFTLKGEQTEDVLADCVFAEGVLRYTKVNRWPDEEGHEFELQPGMTVVVFGLCHGLNEQGRVAFSECEMHTWSMRNNPQGRRDPRLKGRRTPTKKPG